MKLKYLSFAMIAMAAMASCQSEDTPDPADARVSLSVGATLGGSLLRAEDTNALSGEATVNRLTAFLFQEDKLVAKKDTADTEDDDPLNRIGNIIVPTGGYDIIIVANADNDILNVSSRTAFDAYTGKLSSQLQSSLLMVSDMMTGVLLESMNNEAGDPLRLTYNYLPQQKENVELSATSRGDGDWYEEDGNLPVKLTRLASRVQLKSITLNFREDLAESSFELKGVYLANVRPGTALIPASGSYETGSSYISGIKPKDGDDLIADVDGVSGFLAKADYDKEITGTEAVGFTDDEMFRGYVFENQTDEALPASYATRMIIAGNVINRLGVDRGLRYYQVEIKDGELARNNIYNVQLTISGLGSDTPGKEMEVAALDFTLDVEDWKVVEHVEDITD